MIKLLEFVRRRPGLNPEAFHAEWREQQTHFFANAPEAAQWVLRRELNHRLPEDYVRARHVAETTGLEWDGVEVSWFSSLEDFQALKDSPAFIEFRERENSAYRGADRAQVLTRDAIRIVDKPGARERAGLKLLCILRRRPGLDRAHFLRHWREHHGGLFRDIPDLNEPLLGYDQNHGLADAEYDGVTEQWFASLPEWLDSLNVPANFDQVIPDVGYMLDPESIQFILAGQPTLVRSS